MYLGGKIPLFFLLFNNPYSSKTISEDDKTNPTFSLPTSEYPSHSSQAAAAVAGCRFQYFKTSYTEYKYR